MLTWEQREAGLPGQWPLPGMEDVPTIAERSFLRLARRWHAAFVCDRSVSTPMRGADATSLAALLLAREHGRNSTDVATEVVEQNLERAEFGCLPWIDQLSWRLVAASREADPASSDAMKSLTVNLNHHDSSIRIWMMEIGWMVRPWLDRQTALPALLSNVAGTLGGVERAWALAGGLFDSEHDFVTGARAWTPDPRFADQYVQRCKALEEHGLLACQAGFWSLEAACRRLIEGAAFA